MKDNNLKASKRSSNKNQTHNLKLSDWTPKMNKIKRYNNVTNGNQIWSMDTNTLVTKQGYLYILSLIFIQELLLLQISRLQNHLKN